MAIAMSQGGGQNQVSWCGEDFEKYEVLLETLVVLLRIEIVLYSIHFIIEQLRKGKTKRKYPFRYNYPIL